MLTSLKCHVDVQMSDGRGMLLKYVSGYVPKFSDSFTTEWLSDACSDYCVARRVLTDYHPLEPEMVLQLAAQWFPQCVSGSTMQPFRVPVPWDGPCPARVGQYMASTWRAEDMPLIEFLRKTNSKGAIHHYLAKVFKGLQEDGEELLEETLEAWANAAPTRGQVAIATLLLSRYNDKYYGQWVLLCVPFRSLDEHYRPELEKVPPHLYYQTLALLHRPDHWRNEAAIRADLELEGFREHHIRNIIAMLVANQGLIEQYLDGRLDKDLDGPTSAGGFAEGAGDHMALSRQQTHIQESITESVEQGMRFKAAREEAWKGAGEEDWEDPADMNEHWAEVRRQPAPFAPVAAQRPAIAVLGPAGSGKSTAVRAAIQQVAEKGARVLLAAPTGRLAATLREKFPGLEVDTVHGAFLVYKPIHETLELMWP